MDRIHLIRQKILECDNIKSQNGGIKISKRSNPYTGEFKEQIVSLVNSGKSISEAAAEYIISKFAVHKWTHSYNNSNSFKAKDSLSDAEKELIKARKEIQHLNMENDILKQAALIMGRK